MISLIKSAWNKEAKLWKVYWLLGVLVSAFIKVLDRFFGDMISPVSVFWPVLLGVAALYNVFWVICLWKCSWNCGWRGWGYIARVIAIIAMIFTGLTVFVVGSAMNDDVALSESEVEEFAEFAKFAKCTEQFKLEYGIKDIGLLEFGSPEHQAYSQRCMDEEGYSNE